MQMYRLWAMVYGILINHEQSLLKTIHIKLIRLCGDSMVRFYVRDKHRGQRVRADVTAKSCAYGSVQNGSNRHGGADAVSVSASPYGKEYGTSRIRVIYRTCGLPYLSYL